MNIIITQTKSSHMYTAMQHLLDSFNPHLFFPFISAFKFNYSIGSLYTKVSLLLIGFFSLSSRPRRDIRVDSSNYTCDLAIQIDYRGLR